MTEQQLLPVEHLIADWLLSLLPPGRPRRLARMSYPGETKRQKNKKTGKWETVERGKYEDIYGPLTSSMLVEHARGTVTYSYMLDLKGKARLGAFDVDSGGHDAIVAALEAGRALGLVMFAIELPGEQHNGGHVYAIYDQLYDALDIRAQMQQVVALAGIKTGEIWPGYKQGIRGLFGKHQIKGTRGHLLTQDGEVIDLDTDLAGGFALVEQLPTNATPPTSDKRLSEVQSSHKGDYTKLEKGGNISTLVEKPSHKVIRLTSGRLDTQAIFAEARAKFNADHDWGDLLSEYGGTEVSVGYWACNCGVAHTHSVQIAVTSQDKIISLSNRCGWARDDKALDQFGFWCDQAHRGNYRAAAEAAARQYGLWVEPQAPKAEPADTQYRAPSQDATRKRAQRLAARQERIDRIDPLIAKIEQDSEIRTFDRALFAYHLQCWSSGPEHCASIERITRAVLQLDRTPAEHEYRRVQLAHQRLIKGGYIKRTVRGSKTTKETNCWQPGDGHRVIANGENAAAHQDAQNAVPITLIESSKDLLLESVDLVSRAPSPHHENVYAASIEDWAWQADDGHSPDELSALESGNTMLPVSPVVEPEAESNNLLDVPPAWRLVPDKRGMWSLRGPMGECEWLGRDENNARICWAVKNLQPGQSVHIRNDVLVSPQPPEPVEQLADQGGGYIGYAGGAQFKADYVPSQEVQPVAPAVPTIIQLDPLVQAPPLSSDTTYVNFIKLWYASQPGAICKRTGKAYSAAQRARFKRDYAAYLVDVSPAEAVLRWEALQRPRRSTRPTERARSQAPARRLAPSAMAQEAFYATG